MTIDELVRIIVKQEITALMQGGQASLIPSAASSVPAAVVSPPPPVGSVVGPSIEPLAAPPVAVPPGPPQVAPPIPSGPPMAPPPAPPVPGPQSVAGVPTLDEIRALANDFSRQRPDLAPQFFAFMQSKGVTSLADMPPAEYPACKAELQRLMGAA